MATINLTFTTPINMSCKVGDTAYFVNYPTNTFGGFNVSSAMQLIGVINTTTETTSTTVLNIEEQGINTDTITTSSFIFFQKNNLVEMGSMLGYYATATFRNNSTNKAELYATACEIEESSK